MNEEKGRRRKKKNYGKCSDKKKKQEEAIIIEGYVIIKLKCEHVHTLKHIITFIGYSKCKQFIDILIYNEEIQFLALRHSLKND